MSDSKNETRSGIGVRSRRRQMKDESKEKASLNTLGSQGFEEFIPIQDKIDQIVSPKPIERDPIERFLEFSLEYEQAITKTLVEAKKAGAEDECHFGEWEPPPIEFESAKQVKSNSFLNLLNLSTLLISVVNFAELINARWPTLPVTSAEIIPARLRSPLGESKSVGIPVFDMLSTADTLSDTYSVDNDETPFGAGDHAKDESRLLIGIRTGDLEKVQNSLKNPHIVQRINVPDKDGYPLITLCAAHPNTFILRELITVGARVDAQTPSGDTALTLAVQAPITNSEFLKQLLDHGAYVFHKNKDGLTARDLINRLRAKTPVQTFAQHAIDTSNLLLTEYESFHLYAQQLTEGDRNILQLLARMSAQMREWMREWHFKQSYAGNNHLTLAVKFNRLDVVKQLIAWGADVNLGTTLGKERTLTPLQIAIYNSFYDITQLLLSKGADPNLASDRKELPIFIALNNRFNENDNGIVDELLKYPVKLDVEISSGIENIVKSINPLDLALLNLDIPLAKKIIEKGIKPTIMSFISAMNKNRTESVQFLIDSNLVDINQVFPFGAFKGFTPVEFASLNHYYPSLIMLGDAGADLGNGATKKNYLEAKAKLRSTPRPESFSTYLFTDTGISVSLIVMTVGYMAYTFKRSLSRPSVSTQISEDEKEKKHKFSAIPHDSFHDKNYLLNALDTKILLACGGVIAGILLSFKEVELRNVYLAIAAFSSAFLPRLYEKRLPKSIPLPQAYRVPDAKLIKQKAAEIEQYLIAEQQDINSVDNKHLGLDNSITKLDQDIETAKTFIRQKLQAFATGSTKAKQDSLSELDNWLNLFNSKEGKLKKQIAHFSKEKDAKLQGFTQQKKIIKQQLRELHSQLEKHSQGFAKLLEENTNHAAAENLVAKLEALLKISTAMQTSVKDLNNQDIVEFSKQLEPYLKETHDKIAALDAEYKLILDQLEVSKAIANLKMSYQDKLKQVFPELRASERVTSQDFSTRHIIRDLSTSQSSLRYQAQLEAKKKITRLEGIEKDLETLETDINALSATSSLLEVSQLQSRVDNQNVVAIRESIADANLFIDTSSITRKSLPIRRNSFATFFDGVERSSVALQPHQPSDIKSDSKNDKKTSAPKKPISESKKKTSPPKEKKTKPKAKNKQSVHAIKTNQLKNVLEAAVGIISGIEAILTNEESTYFKLYPRLCRQAMLGAMLLICKDLYNVLNEHPIGRRCISIHINLNHYDRLIDGISSPEQVAQAFKLFSTELKHFQAKPDPEGFQVFTTGVEGNLMFSKLLLPKKYQMQDPRDYLPSDEEPAPAVLRQAFMDTLSRVKKTHEITPEIQIINQLASDYLSAKANDQHESEAVEMNEVKFRLNNPGFSLDADRKAGNRLRHLKPSETRGSYIEELHQTFLEAGDPDFKLKGNLLLRSSAALTTAVRRFSSSPISATASSSVSSSASSSTSSVSNSFVVPGTDFSTDKHRSFS